MSGDSEAPPTYYYSGITFNPSFYQSASDYLTKTTAKNYFLTYPIQVRKVSRKVQSSPPIKAVHLALPST